MNKTFPYQCFHKSIVILVETFLLHDEGEFAEACRHTFQRRSRCSAQSMAQVYPMHRGIVCAGVYGNPETHLPRDQGHLDASEFTGTRRFPEEIEGARSITHQLTELLHPRPKVIYGLSLSRRDHPGPNLAWVRQYRYCIAKWTTK